MSQRPEDSIRRPIVPHPDLDALAALSFSDRAKAHLVAHVDIGLPAWTSGNLTVIINDRRFERGRVVIDLEATLDGVPVEFSKPLEIVNPPVLVDDGAGNLRYDPAAAFKQIIEDFLRSIV